mgnify:FL=1
MIQQLKATINKTKQQLPNIPYHLIADIILSYGDTLLLLNIDGVSLRLKFIV